MSQAELNLVEGMKKHRFRIHMFLQDNLFTNLCDCQGSGTLNKSTDIQLSIALALQWATCANF